MEGNNGMEKTRELFKKIRDSNGTYNEKMDTIKDRKSMNLREAEYIKKRWQEIGKSTRLNSSHWW